MPLERQPAPREPFAWNVVWAILLLLAVMVAAGYFFWYIPSHR